MKKIIKWLDNFWYHYKWRTILIVFFAAIFIVCIAQCTQKTDPDVSILYAGPSVVSAEAYDEIGKVFASRLEKDYNGDGHKIVDLTDVVILSDEQLAQKKEEAAADDDYLWYDNSSRQEAFETVKNWLVSGQMLLCILDPYVYDLLSEQNLFVPLEEYLDEIPACANDAYSLRLSEMAFTDYFDILDPIAEDTLLCLVSPTFVSALNPNKDDSRYEAHIALIERMLAFGAE